MDIYGETEARKPFAIPNLRLDGSLKRIYDEMMVRLRKYNVLYLLGNYIVTKLGKLYLSYTPPGRAYLKEVIDLTDTLVLDGKLNTVISSTTTQRENLVKKLDALEKEGKILYGLHISQESVMSCYVRRIQNQHIHFVDGAGGGYTQAARVLKKKQKGDT